MLRKTRSIYGSIRHATLENFLLHLSHTQRFNHPFYCLLSLRAVLALLPSFSVVALANDLRYHSHSGATLTGMNRFVFSCDA
ncbi:hypothetical protein BDN70DRAFT_515633 [Pholiota conissans]|uniref:Uncharacterized protein n=1 Tax=Pholiota conissans TaxID=109636 RepID=A0A9P6CTV5_9AGAR|nr:hypothetical protein BDN70DRAFT_515633 [Pholiota conissans]